MRLKAIQAACALFFAASTASAGLPPDVEAELGSSINTVMCYIYAVLKGIVGPIAVMILVWIGTQYLSAGDDIKRREKAKSDMKELIIALIFIMVIPELVKTVAGGDIPC